MSVLKVNLVSDTKYSVSVPFNKTTTAEDVCVTLCKQLEIGPVARHLFALRVTDKGIYLKPSAEFGPKNPSFDLRIRFKPASVQKLKKIDIKAYDYYFYQVRQDVLENKVPDIVYDKYRKELLGLGITDMYRVMLEKNIPKETLENEYKKYMPKEVFKRHFFFLRKPIHNYLGQLTKGKYDAW